MSLQLLSIAIYNKDGKRRDVHFRPGKLNVITGKSLTGKSALIDILDFCLGRDKYVVPSGVITDCVVWYVAHFVLPHTQVIVGRPAPVGAASTTAVYLEVGGELSLPEFSALKVNSNTIALEQYLSEAIGITGNEHVPGEGQSRQPLQANVSHARFLLFQPQSIIADRDILFYRQKEQFIPQSIKDTLPYFLGATGDDQYERLQQLRRLRRELRLRERRLDEEKALRGRETDRALSLFAEAQECGLIVSTAPAPSDFDEIVAVIAPLAEVQPRAPELESSDAIRSLSEQREALVSQMREVQSEIEAARAFATAQDAFSSEANTQRNRLASVNLYGEDTTGHKCPLCDNQLEDSVPKADAVRHSLANLEKQIGAASRQRPRLDSFLNEREEVLTGIRQELRANRAAIDGLIERQEALQRERTRFHEQARVLGRISLFTESVQAVEENSDLQFQIRELQRKVAELENGLSEDSIDDQLGTRLQLLSTDMTRWAKEMELEHSQWPIGFDLKNLTVIAHRASGPIRLYQMGGGKNWMGYHVAFFLSLHKLLREFSRPVPGILVLDQPTQVYFPAERVEDRSIGDLPDEDQETVHRLFKIFYSFVADLAPNMQVIVTDHADLNEDWFQESVVERWRGDKKLVPLSWITPEDGDSTEKFEDGD